MSYLDSLRVFVRVVARGSISAGGRDLRLTPAAASNRIKDLELRFGLRLLNRTTRKLAPTEVGALLYESARKVIAALDETEAMLASYSGTPQGVLSVVAPLGLGRRVSRAHRSQILRSPSGDPDPASPVRPLRQYRRGRRRRRLLPRPAGRLGFELAQDRRLPPRPGRLARLSRQARNAHFARRIDGPQLSAAALSTLA